MIILARSGAVQAVIPILRVRDETSHQGHFSSEVPPVDKICRQDRGAENNFMRTMFLNFN